MKICLFAHSFPPDVGGGETHVYLLANGLSKRGYDVTVVTGTSRGQKTQDIFPFRILRVENFREFENGRLSLREFLPAAKTALLSRRFDVVHVHNFMPGLAYAVIAPLIKTKTVFTYHSTPVPVENKILGHFSDFELERIFTAFIFKLPFYRWCVCPSRYYYDWAIRLGVPRKKLRLVYHGIDVGRFNLPRSEKWRKNTGFKISDFVVICPARMVHRKGIFDLLQAINLIEDERIKLYITTSIATGSQEYADKILNYIRDCRLLGRVKVGFDHDAIHQMPIIYAGCDALVLPSHIEGLGVVLLEGMAAGIPVIGSETNGIKEVIKDGVNGLFFQARNPVDIAEKIIKIATDKKLVRRLIKGGKVSVSSRFSLERQLDKLEKIYRS